jgi:hypothetical protein
MIGDEQQFPPSSVSVALGVCDGHCVPDECVCPSSAQRVAEIQAAVRSERERIVAWHREQAELWDADADAMTTQGDTWLTLKRKAGWHRDCADHLEQHGAEGTP